MLHVEVVRTPNFDEWSAAIQAGAEDAAPQMANALRARAVACIDRRTDPWGNVWPPPKRESKSHGELRGSLMSSPSTPTPGRTTATVTATAPYASIRQFGNRHAPATPFLPVRAGHVVDMPAEQRAELVAIARDAITARVRAASARSGGALPP